MKTIRAVVVQKGAREHFLAARAFHRKGALVGLVVDWYFYQKGFLRLLLNMAARFLGARGRSALAAGTPELPDKLVKVNWLNGLAGKWRQRVGINRPSSIESALAADIAFTRRAARTRVPRHNVFFGYSYMSLELLQREKRDGVLTILGQIDPGPVEFRIVADEMRKHPELAGPPKEFPSDYYDRLKQEWELADVIAVNSEWSRSALIQEGVPARKIEVLPLAFEAPSHKTYNNLLNSSTSQPFNEQNPLRVLFLGQVNVRKGIHYLIEAARLLVTENVHFDVVGAVGISRAVIEGAPSNMTFHGPVGRDQAEIQYRTADIFILPTLSDGFAITQIEALSWGLPLIVTPCCGTVVVDGETGFIVNPKDASALASGIGRFISDRQLAVSMRTACMEAARGYSIDAYADRLTKIITQRLKSPVINP